LIWEHRLRNDTESRYFCAKGNGQETPCARDDPLYIKTKDLWHIGGLNIRHYSSANGDLERSILYEDTTFYARWIQEKNEKLI